MAIITVGICTYKRPLMLENCVASVIDSIENLSAHNLFEIVIVDNDPECSAYDVINRINHTSIECRYISEKVKGISSARNAALNCCQTPYLCFVDDDEYVSTMWAAYFLDAAKNIKAEVVLAPVVPVYPSGTEHYFIESKIYDRPRFTTGTVVDKGGTGNTLIDVIFVKKHQIFFDNRYGLTGGEDSRFFADLQAVGGVMKWLDEAVVYEPVAKERLSLKYIAQRSLRGGQTHVDIYLKGFSKKSVNLVVRLVETLALSLPVFILWFINKRFFLKLYRRLFAALGQVLGTFNKKFEMY